LIQARRLTDSTIGLKLRWMEERWQSSQLSDVSAKLLIYQAFVEGELEVPRHLDRRVHDLYFNPTVEEFQPRTMWSLSNAFTSAFKELDPIPQYKATGRLAGSSKRSVGKSGIPGSRRQI
jgi:hypothetical protein